MTARVGVTTALRALNDAAHAAIRAGLDTVQYPDLDRQTLRWIAEATDRLVDANGAAARTEGSTNG